MISGRVAAGRWQRVVFGGALVVFASGFTGPRPGSDRDAPDTAPPDTLDAAGTVAEIVYAGETEAALVVSEGVEELAESVAAGIQVAMVEAESLSGTRVPLDLSAEVSGTLTGASGAPSGVVMTDPSRRAFPTHGTELAWHGVHDGVDSALWRRNEEPSTPGGRSGHEHILPRALHGIGFPSIELVESLPRQRRRSWRRMVSWHESPDAPGRHEPIPHVRCMGLSPAAVARRAARFEPLVIEYSIEYGVSASLVKALISVESCFDPKAVSHVGAIGLMQLMPATAAWLKAGDPRNVRNNLRAGIRYLASLRRTFGSDRLALAAYNAGPGNVRRYGGVPPFAETRGYVKKVLSHRRRYVAATALAVR